MARRRKRKISGWAMFGCAIVLGLFLGPAVVAGCFFIAVIKALNESD